MSALKVITKIVITFVPSVPPPQMNNSSSMTNVTTVIGDERHDVQWGQSYQNLTESEKVEIVKKAYYVHIINRRYIHMHVSDTYLSF